MVLLFSSHLGQLSETDEVRLHVKHFPDSCNKDMDKKLNVYSGFIADNTKMSKVAYDAAFRKYAKFLYFLELIFVLCFDVLECFKFC
jgi:hypothetical protein